MTISSIHIENIRGFSSQTITLELRPNITNIVVAPNGFGKSSISTAFQSASGNRLSVADQDKHKSDAQLPSVLQIVLDGTNLRADSAQNQISENVNVHVIKSGLIPKAKVPRINGVPIPRPYLEISDIDLGPVAPRTDLPFDAAAAKAKYQENKKVSPNVQRLLGKPRVQEALLDVLTDLDKLKQAKRKGMLEDLLAFIVAKKGTQEVIKAAAEAQLRPAFDNDETFPILTKLLLAVVSDCDWTTAVLLLLEMAEIIEAERANFKRWLQRGAFEARLERARKFIEDVNSGWVSAEVKEVRDRMKVIFPPAGQLSNGQRDLLFLASNFLKVLNFKPSSKTILVIDEVFDYLDDANLTVAQYFLSNIVEEYRTSGGRIYPILLTHLDPSLFKGYALRRRNVIYLGIPTQQISNTMKTIISRREEPAWKDDLEKHFLHYHPTSIDISQTFNKVYQLPKKHGQSHDFYEFLANEWTKLDQGQDDYDPFAVCAYVRIQIERLAYGKLVSQDLRTLFLDTHGTGKKLELLNNYGIQTPEVWTLLGVIYNEALHTKGALDQTSTISLKVRNLGLRQMIRRALSP